ncbi:PQQ-dependent sugar dehydrogenase [Niabella ginsengisoli]|uniref:PQQ-dependent sugar dehydrogenase n=1 Tax=Niabella ginsengisoli TaxID=522298 RepID=A0ABS9SNN3_9BACT|nr:PQQ-dependent sugar dehydrogenase [Niabella ginsengisoli]MCH5599998.1 PQQ-dependent sugar dehydrogenase [Niabella ginsengisoli]
MAAKRTLCFLLPVLVSLFCISSVFAQPEIGYESGISTGLTGPIDIVNAGDGTNRIFVVERTGTIKVYDQSLTYLSDFLTVSGIGTEGEGGLLSLAFHPSYESNGFFYVYYTLPNFSLEIARYSVSADANSGDPASKEIVLNIPHPTFSNHNGGKILFGPDGYLYLATGDGGSGGDPNNNAQNGNSLLGKMLRINVTTTATAPFYTIPPDNPYVANADVLDEIWAIGLRNPFRWSFDRTTGDMWIADVGQSAQEEINYRPSNATAGINYGWRCYEGTAAYNTTDCLPQSSYISPIFTYGRDDATGGQSVTGGFVYRGAEFPSMQGYYIFSDYVSDNQWIASSDGVGGWNVQQQNSAGLPADIVAFGEAENGTLYAASLSGNTIYKVVDNAALPVTFGSIKATRKSNLLQVNWVTESETNNSHFDIEISTDGEKFSVVKTIESKATDGNSSTPINYEIRLGKESLGTVLGFSLFAVAILFGFSFRKKWKLIPLTALVFFIVTNSCNKKDPITDPENKNLFVRIAQVDKDGTKRYSKIIQVVNE